jgi:serine/threonine-protein kinase
MTPERWAQLKDIFSAVTELPAEERTPALIQACQGDTHLQAELQQLLAQYEEMGEFLDGRPPASAASLFTSGTLLANRYEVVTLLGSGGMGEVYEAQDKELSCRVALKVVRAQTSINDPTLERFRREVQLARQVTHPNVCRVFDIGRHQQQGREIVFLTMEFVPGETLAARLKRERRIALEEARAIAQQLCQALGAAHRAGVLHRDFKPGNVMLTGSEEKVHAVVTDFGIARWIGAPADSPGTLTTQGAIFGTPAYMSPEQIQGKELTAASDIYSLGLVLYEMVTGVRPFHDESSWGETLKRLTADPPEPRKIVSDLDQIWNRTILKCLERDPARRIASAAEVLETLSGTRKRFSVLRKQRRRVALAGALSVAVVVSAALLWGRFGLRALPASKHVAVLPFTFAGNDAANQASAYGLSESLAGNLARLETTNSSLWVVPWSQVRSWKAENSEHASASLGVNLLVTGQVERRATSLRLHAEIRDASTLQALRAQTIELPAPEIMTLEDTLLERVAEMLQVQLPAGMLHHLPVDQTTIPGAYEFYEQGRGYLRHDDPENVDRAIALLQKAIEADSRFAIAYADLAHADNLKYHYTQDGKWLDQARQNATRALSLNDGLAAAHLAQGMTLQSSGDLDGAIGEFRRALSLDPSDDEILRRLALAYDNAGKVLEAETLIKDTIKHNPASWVSYNFLGYFYFHHAQYDQAEPLFRAASQLAPDYPLALYNLGGVDLALGKYKEAEAILTRAVALKPSANAYSNLGTAYFHLGNYSEATAAFLKATELTPKDYSLWINLADAYDMAGDRNQASRAYERAIQELNPVLALRPNDASLREELAFCQAKLGRQKEAGVNLVQAMRHAPDDPEFLFKAARIYERTGQRDQALATLRSAIRNGYSLSEIQSDSALAQLRADPRYVNIVSTASGKPKP